MGTLIMILLMLPLTWLFAGLPFPSYGDPTPLTVSIHILVWAGVGAFFVVNGLWVGSCLDKWIPKSRKSQDRTGLESPGAVKKSSPTPLDPP